MVLIHEGAARGKTQTGWLDSRHTFSFGGFRDPRRMGFHSLRVINEDRVAPGAGFGTHGHQDMEILTYVVSGALAHKDSLGNGSIIQPGEIQRMSAGAGVAHSEMNASGAEPVHFLQIWIEPAERGLPPSYEQAEIQAADISNRFGLIAGPGAGAGAVTLHQDARIFAARLDAARSASIDVEEGRGGFLQLVKGRAKIGDEGLGAGDGVQITGPRSLALVAETDVEALLFDLG